MSYKCLFKSGAAVILIMFLTACATTTDYAKKAGITIERVDSSTVNVSHAYLAKTADGLLLRGEVKRKIHSHGSIPGHLHIELIDPQGQLIKTAEVDHSRKGSSDHIADFQVLLPLELSVGSVIRVVHHDASSHKEEDDMVDWMDVDK